MSYPSDEPDEDGGYYAFENNFDAPDPLWRNIRDSYVPSKTRLEHLGFVPNFRPVWGLQEAFRELGQD
jgi:hypothetical protein